MSYLLLENRYLLLTFWDIVAYHGRERLSLWCVRFFINHKMRFSLMVVLIKVLMWQPLSELHRLCGSGNWLTVCVCSVIPSKFHRGAYWLCMFVVARALQIDPFVCDCQVFSVWKNRGWSAPDWSWSWQTCTTNE